MSRPAYRHPGEPNAALEPDQGPLPPMFPGLQDWRAARAELDPRGVFRSDLGRRLGLVDS